jgi:NADPH:quinone reductase
MKAAHRQGYLWWSRFEFSNDFAKPKITQPNQVLLQVEAAAINPADYKVPRPFFGDVYGIDVCGRVVEVGSDVSGLQSGDLVFGQGHTGSMAEYCVADAGKVTKVPDWLTPIEAAALPVAYLTAVTAWERVSLFDEAAPPESMMIIGASGGCGLAASQLAKGFGVNRIIGVCSIKNTSYVKEQGGVTEVLDYSDATAMKEFSDTNAGKIDHIYDTASFSGHGEDYNKWSLNLLKKDTGSYVALNGSVSSFLHFLCLGGSGFSDKRQTLHLTKFSRQGLELLLDLLQKSSLKPDVHVMEFSKVSCEAGFEMLRSRRTKGKIVFDIACSGKK